MTLPKNSHSVPSRIIALVCNSKAGKGRGLQILDKLTAYLKKKDFLFTVYIESWPGDFRDFTEVWVIGGDGTLNFFVNRYPENSLPVALFKGGSGNDFAWKLYGDQSVDEYLETVLKGNPRKVDGGLCNGKYFMNGVGIGFDGDVVRAMGNRKFLSAGHLAYMVIVLRKILFYKEKPMSFLTGGHEWKEKIFMISIANGSRYGGGFLVAPLARINDGKLDIVLIKPILSFKRFFYLPKVEKGKHLSLSFVELFRERKITVRSETPVSAHVDGEPMQSNEYRIEILPAKFSFYY